MTEKDPCILSYHDSIVRKSDLQILNNSDWINDRLIGFILEYFERELFSNLSDSVAFIQPEISQLIKLCIDGNDDAFKYSTMLHSAGNSPLMKFVDRTFHDTAYMLLKEQLNLTFAGADIELVLDSLNLPGKELIFLPVNDSNKTTKAGGSHWTLLTYIRSHNCYLHMDSLYNSQNIYSAKITAKKLNLVLKSSRNQSFVEIKDGPKQDNSYDCGMYVICAIELICKRYLNDSDTGFIADRFGCICSSLTPQLIQQERLKLDSLIMSLKMNSA